MDDDADIRESLRELLERVNHTVVEAPDGKTALDVVDRDPPGLVLLDLDLPRIRGMEVLERLTETHPALPVVIVSGRGGVPEAVQATKLGAYDYLEKPVEAARALLTVRNALERSQVTRERDLLLTEARERYQMVGASAPMQRVYRQIEKAACVPSTVLITGESGTGKERVARALHLSGPRAVQPFVAVNCAALPDDLVESELFGHEKGAFTGAHARREGAFERAGLGTLFLDEVGDLGASAQAKVLRALEEREVRRVGGRGIVPVDARIVAATNRDLQEEVEVGRFREDLLYRLDVLSISLPPLRDRREDVPDLVHHLLGEIARAHGTSPQKIEHPALVALARREWPGNVRQLRNAVERLVVMGTEEAIRAADVEWSQAGLLAPEARVEDLRLAREAFERAHIDRVLASHGGRVREAAEALGIDRSSLWRRLKS
ncbi:MAG: sigma-54 dependent transcriptional regulator [Bacteroidota bacterium]